MDPLVEHVLVSQFGGDCSSPFREDVEACRAKVLLHVEWSDEQLVADLHWQAPLQELVASLHFNPQFLMVCDEYFIEDTHRGFEESLASDAPYLTFQSFLEMGSLRYWARVLRGVRFHLEHNHAQP